MNLRALKGRIARRTFNPNDLGEVQPFLWSKGIASLCDVHGPAGYWQSPTESVAEPALFDEWYGAAHGVVWVRMGTGARVQRVTDLDLFVRHALPTITRPFVLLTTDGDVSVPSELAPETVAALEQSPHLVAWYTQNCDAVDSMKIRPFPIGLDLHTPRPFSSPRKLAADIERIARRRLPLTEQPLRVFSDLAVNLNSYDRAMTVQTLLRCEHVAMLARHVSQQEVWKLYAASPFVLSARGYGADCHRTWEALYLGSIVITKSSVLDPLYTGLPVVLVDDWAEVLDPANLRRWLDEYGPLAERSRVRAILEPSSMLNRIRKVHLSADEAPVTRRADAPLVWLDTAL
ncbi:MAG: hypothetical protein AB7P33_13025 [Dehalococcoidia bacterium]